ncbi:MAG TPA: ribonuclease P [Archaeoglobus profundus]|nr:ribonuclease P [Archaeoglobus profundus]
MKGLPPALKKKKRYIAFQLIGDKRVNEKDFLAVIWKVLISIFGELKSAHAGIWLEYFDGEFGILRCNREMVDNVKVALTLITKIGDVNVIPKILGVSGTIKRCKKKYLEVLKHASPSDGLRPGDHSI